MLETLIVFDKFCREHDLKYPLYAGHLLGAVRHKGVIPWDDDLDVCMERSEYVRFAALWEQMSPREGHVLQNKERAPAYWQSFSKIRKGHTTFLQEERETGKIPCASRLHRICRMRISTCSLKMATSCALQAGMTIFAVNLVTICNCFPRRDVHGGTIRSLLILRITMRNFSRSDQENEAM